MGLIRFRKELIYIGYSTEMKWQLRPVRYSTLGRAETIKLAAQDSGITESQLEQAFDAFAHEIEQLLCNGHSLELGELGKLYLNIKAKAVQSAENVSAELIKYCHLMLTPTKQFKEEMKQIKHIIEPVPDFYISKRCPFNAVGPTVEDPLCTLKHVSVVHGGAKIDTPVTLADVRNMRLNGSIAPTVVEEPGGGAATATFDIPGDRQLTFAWDSSDNMLTLDEWPHSGADFIVTGMGSVKGL